MASEHWCQVHKTKFFKTANMKSYAHPVKDADGKLLSWCNEDAQETEPKQAETAPQKEETPKQEFKSRSEEIETNMWWKILADLIIHKEIDTTKPAGKLLRTALMAKMLSVLDIKIANKEP